MRTTTRTAVVAALLALGVAASAQADTAMISGKCKATGWGRGALASDLPIGTTFRFRKLTYIVVGPLSRPGIVVTACPGFKARRATYSASAVKPTGLSVVRKATARFHDVGTALAAGFVKSPDAQGIACIDNPGTGGMGIHFARTELVLDGAVDAATPEVLVYEPKADGGLRLVAAEYIVFKDAWDANHTSRPSLFGQPFEDLPSPNRYGLPAAYELHAWVWKHNPRGMFDDWNPRVSCAADTSGR
jgi:hypothetical protein